MSIWTRVRADSDVPPWQLPAQRPSLIRVFLAFLSAVPVCLLIHYLLLPSRPWIGRRIASPLQQHFANPDAGSTERDHFPPVSPINVYPSLFPTNVGYAGSTRTGAEPALVATAPSYPIQSGAAGLVVPTSLAHQKHGSKHKNFSLLRSWGNISPWYSVERAFGLDSSPEAPDSCRITGMHLLYRHGARYPTDCSYGGPCKLASKLHAAASRWNGTGNLEFMNDWTFKLGEEILTPFGRQQLFDLGVSMRLKYGSLLKNFSESNTLPVFRTESEERMVASARYFALGFFGYPLEGKYQQSIMIEAEGFNNTLSPYHTCRNFRDPDKGDRGRLLVPKWASIYLKRARARLAPQLKGYGLSIEDVYTMQEMCAFETVMLGFSKFCALFTEKEWEGFDYTSDLFLWYNAGFGAPLARALGIGYVQELVARLTHTPIQMHNSSTNATLDDNPITFPLSQSLYIDATHDVVLIYLLTALNLTNFAESGPLPTDHIPSHLPFKASQLGPFGANLQFQLLECASVPGQQIRIVLNDGVVPLTSIKGCPRQKDGMCPVERFVTAQREMISQTDWAYICDGDWEVPEGWQTTTGSPS